MEKIAAYINTVTNEYPRYEGDIRLMYPDMGEQFVLPDEYSPVYMTETPILSEYQNCVQGQPNNVNGKWYVSWIVENTQPIFKHEAAFGNNVVYRTIFKETLWSDKKIYREAISIITKTGSEILKILKDNFPNCEAGDDPLECIGYTPENVRPPYSNPTISWYAWKRPSDDILIEYGVSDYVPYNVYGKKFDLTTGEVMLKVMHNSAEAAPPDLPVGWLNGYGRLYYQNKTKDENVDYYFAGPQQQMIDFCERNNIQYPAPLDLDVVGWGIVYNINTLEIVMVKAYHLPDVKLDD